MIAPPRASASVVAAGIVAILAGVLAACFIGFAGLATFRLSLPQSSPPFSSALRPILYGSWIFFLLCAMLVTITGINVLRVRNWARIAMLVVSGCGLFFGVTGIGVIFVTVFLAPSEPPGGRATLAVVFSVIYGVPIAVALWWLILFTRASVSAQFRAAEYFRNPGPYLTSSPAPSPQSTPTGVPTPLPGLAMDPALVPQPTPPPGSFTRFFGQFNHPSNPLPIRIIGWYLASFVLFLPLYPFIPFRFPTIFFGHTFHGSAAYAVTGGTMAVVIASGFGLLLLKRWSFPLVAGYQLVAIVNAVLLTRSGLLETQLREMMSAMQLPAPAAEAAINQAMQTFHYASFLGLAIPVAILVTLFISRKGFFAAANLPTSVGKP